MDMYVETNPIINVNLTIDEVKAICRDFDRLIAKGERFDGDTFKFFNGLKKVLELDLHPVIYEDPNE